MLTTHLKKYDLLDVADNIRFHTHNDFLDSYFGEHGSPQSAVLKINNKCRVWMPKFSKDGRPFKASSGWINERRDNGNIIITTAPTVSSGNIHLPLDYITLVFGKNGFDDYTFYGAYIEDQNESTDIAFFFRRVAKRVKLNGNPVRSIELLDEDRSAFEPTYIFRRPIDAQTGQFDSWLIFSDKGAAEETDKSFFLDNSTTVHQEVKWFFEAEKLGENESLDITIEYSKNKYPAYLKAKGNEVKIFWDSSLGALFQEHFDTIDIYPIITFLRIGKATYKVEFLNDERKKLVEPLDDMHSLEEQEIQAKSMDENSLKAAALKRSGKIPVQKQITITQHQRDPYIAEYAKQRANGFCQLCGEKAPFIDANGKPYLESHHIIWLANGGEDSIENTVALCPNCHKKMHIVKDPEDVKLLLAVTASENRNK